MPMSPSAKEISYDLQQKLVDYWHDVDFDWSRNAGSYYTDDAVFGDPANTHGGREAKGVPLPRKPRRADQPPSRGQLGLPSRKW